MAPLRQAILAIACASLSSAVGPGLPKLVGVQGLDDQSMSDAAFGMAPGVLEARYAAELADIHPGLRRYNFFWSGLEGAVPPAATRFACPPGTTAVPANETDRVARALWYGFARCSLLRRSPSPLPLAPGNYHLFHCYDSAMISQTDTLLGADAAIGAASAFIVYGSPSWAANPACTGFPWGPGPNYRQGCE